VCAFARAIFSCAEAQAAFVYGDFTGTDVKFLAVTEDSATNPGQQLFGPPTVTGDGLSFTPTSNFNAQSSGGGGPPDTTDGHLTTTIQSLSADDGIHTVAVSERGDYTLVGTGTSATFAEVAAPVFLTITAVDGVPITPIPISANETFTPNGGVYTLPGNAGISVAWTGSLALNIDAVLAANNIWGHATEIQYAMDNTLVAQSETGTSSFIEKKNAILGLQVNVPMNMVPEPSTIVLLATGALGALALRAGRRRRSGS
jgi:hypothetical protein